MKTCAKCKEEKSLDEFAARKGSRGGPFQKQPWCKVCRKLHYKRTYSKEKSTAWNRDRRHRRYRKLFAYFADHPCVDCGETNPIVLEFDHRDRSQKLCEVAVLIGSTTWKNVLKEIKKCDVLCANCHRVRTAKQFRWHPWFDSESITGG